MRIDLDGFQLRIKEVSFLKKFHTFLSSAITMTSMQTELQ